MTLGALLFNTISTIDVVNTATNIVINISRFFMFASFTAKSSGNQKQCVNSL